MTNGNKEIRRIDKQLAAAGYSEDGLSADVINNFAKQLSYTQSTVAAFECKRHPATLQKFLRIANALDCKVLVIPADKLAAFDDD